jgi:hypothetical protein
MDVYYFTEMPYAEFPEAEAEKFPSMRLTFPQHILRSAYRQRLIPTLFRRISVRRRGRVRWLNDQ